MDEETQRVGALEISQNLRFQEREWVAQRIGWIVMALFIAAALIGLFGDGSVGHASIGDSTTGLSVTYARFARFQAATDLTVRFPPDAGREVRILVSRSFADRVSLESVVPPAAACEGGDEAIAYVFRPAEGQSISRVTFHFQPSRSGKLGGWIRKGSEVVRFSGWVYP